MFPIIGDVVIRTNGGELLVNAPADTVNHYGATDIVSIKSVSNHSYYEYGQTTLVDITNGRIVLTDSSKASVETVFLSATGDIYDNIIIATQNGASLPEVVARDEVSAPSSGTKTVVTIQNNVDQNGENPSKVEVINLYPAEDVQEKDNGYNVSDLGILVVEAISSEGITRAEQQITNAEKALVVAVADHSFAAYGYIGTAIVESGHFVAKETSFISQIKVEANASLSVEDEESVVNINAADESKVSGVSSDKVIVKPTYADTDVAHIKTYEEGTKRALFV